MAPVVPFVRTLFPSFNPKGPVPGGDDVLAVKRAISRAGYFKWGKFHNFYGSDIAKAVQEFQKKNGLPSTGTYTKATHEKLRNTKSKGKPKEWAFDATAIELMNSAYAKSQEDNMLEKAREILIFCKRFDGPYVYGGEHDATFLDDDQHDGFDCSSSTSYVLWKFGLLGATRAQVSGWFETWGESGRGKYITIHANGDHVWIEFDLPEGYFRFDTSPHGDGPRGPRVRRKPRFDSGFVHRHPKGM